MNDQAELHHLLTVLRRVCTRRGWRLFSCRGLGITELDAAHQMAALLQKWQEDEGHREISDTLVERAATRVYCLALHRAIGLDGTEAQDCALIDLWNWITPIVRRYVRDKGQVEACANDVLLTIWQKVETIRDPGSLLAFSATTASRAAFRMLGKDLRYELSLDPAEAAVDQDVEEYWRQHAAAEQHLLSESALTGESIGKKIELESSQIAFEKLIRQCLRSLAQQEVFIDVVLRGLTISEVAAKLGITPNNVSVLKHHAKTALARCKILVEALGRGLVTQSEVRHDAC